MAAVLPARTETNLRARAENNEIGKIGLLEAHDEERLDNCAPTPTSTRDQTMATVGTLERPEDGAMYMKRMTRMITIWFTELVVRLDRFSNARAPSL